MYTYQGCITLKVLVIEDNIHIADMLKLRLAEFGHIVTLAYTKDVAVTAVLDNDIDIVLVDICLTEHEGDTSGIDAVAEIRRIRHDVKIIMLTSNDDPILVSRSILAGADNFLYKNKFNLDNISEKIKVMMEEKQPFEILRKEIILNDLTFCEKKIFFEAKLGADNKQIAKNLKLRLNTVKWHVSNIFRKLNVADREELIEKY